ncbi:MAG: response regulator transcription factor [Bacteroidota bacterium]|nr:response regulator transcription factor [Bacteroidota bacterium]MDP4216812.1 response regulator transcription factor [Bacteroidota bacterium]MDP4246934.1 response regulator transcription factor [Bacteroidota bacterium]MDP4252911.1 response regulator transcription factor [Bacteroidota bacterium]MDP4259759.1 response regulator transcription factor [Bacteroidota bacterium]
MNLLIVEDEPGLLKTISTYLLQSNFACDLAPDFNDAQQKLECADYDCVILDISLPDGNGLALLKQLKEEKKSDGVLIISARNSLDDKLEGLELGADDYLTKPFHLAELAARVNAIIRRRSFEGNNMIELDKLTINMVDKSVQTENGLIDLTRKEYELLLYFTSNKNKVVTRESIVDHLWGDSANMADSFDFIYSHIKNLRKKLSEAGCPDYIRSVYGIGYRFSVE